MTPSRRSLSSVRNACALIVALALSKLGFAQTPVDQPREAEFASKREHQALVSEPLPAPPPESATVIPDPAAPLSSVEYSTGEFWIGAPPEGAPTAPLMVPPLEVDPETGLPITPTPVVPPLPSQDPQIERFGYNANRGQTSWIIGRNDHFGIVSLESLASLETGEARGFVLGFSVHFLDGPIVTDMPARLFDFVIGYQVRRWITPNFGVDLVARVGAYSDFEGSAEDGVRFPSHAVSFLRINPAWELLLGIDYLDRDDIRLLPVVGAAWTPNDYVRIDAVFPRPAAAVRVGESNEWLYVRGQLGGGTWAIERVPAHTNDNATYSDLRLLIGIETHNTDLLWSAIEVGYVFDRQLSYSSSPTDFIFGDAVMINFTNTY